MRKWRAKILGGVVVCALAAVSMAVPSGASPRPIRVLVFSKAYGYVHASITTGARYLLGLNGKGFQVVNTENPAALNPTNLSHFDVLVWNNSTGNVPLSATRKAQLLAWVRAGHGFVGIHSSGDSNYSWPEFSEVAGGLYLAHLYKFGGGGFTPDPTPLALIKEDPKNPLMQGVPADFNDLDETYRWQIDPRADVHVLMSMDNVSVYEGAAYSYHSPVTWCRPFGAGRTWYTNLGHGTWEWQDKVFLRMLHNALDYAGGRLMADCSVPADPNTGVTGAERMEAVWADHITHASPEVSTYSGGMAVLTKIAPGATVTWHRVNLTGVRSLQVFGTAQTIGPPNNTEGVGLVGSPVQQRITPASGGDVEIRVDSATGPLLGTVTIPSFGSPLERMTLPEQLASAAPVVGQTSWGLLSPSAFTQRSGVHDLVLVFRGTSPAQSATSYVASLGWIRLVR